MSEFKRKFRELEPETKQKISLANKGKRKSEIHKQHISQGMLKYWETVEHRPENNGSKTLNNEEK